MIRAPHRWMLRELLLALTVLALAFLNFGHTNQAFAAGGRVVATTSAYCGNPFVPADGDHAPCHVCRVGVAIDLPPPAPAVEPVVFVALPVAYPPLLREPLDGVPLHLARPRGPPLFA